jgi:hypothetical protein
MNRFKRLSLIALTFAVMIGGCTKVELPPKNDHELNESIVNSSSTPKFAEKMRYLHGWVDVFYDYVTGETHTWHHVWFCAWPPSNCLPTAVIKGSSGDSNFELYEEFERHVETETTHLYFSGNDYKALLPGIDSLPEALNKLRNGDVEFFKRQNRTENENTYFLAFDRDLQDTLWSPERAEVTFEFIITK